MKHAEMIGLITLTLVLSLAGCTKSITSNTQETNAIPIDVSQREDLSQDKDTASEEDNDKSTETPTDAYKYSELEKILQELKRETE